MLSAGVQAVVAVGIHHVHRLLRPQVEQLHPGQIDRIYVRGPYPLRREPSPW